MYIGRGSGSNKKSQGGKMTTFQQGPLYKIAKKPYHYTPHTHILLLLLLTTIFDIDNCT